MAVSVTGGSTDVSWTFKLRLIATGLEATGLAITDMDFQYTRSGAVPAAKVDATALAATDSAHADNKAIELDSVDQPGDYRTDWPDAAFAAGVREVILTVKHASCFSQDLRVLIDPPVNPTKWKDGTIPTPNQTGVPIVDLGYVEGTGVDPEGIVDVNVVELGGSAANLAKLAAIAASAVIGTVEDHASNSATVFQTDLAESQNDYYGGAGGGCVLAFTTGTNAQQARRISGYVGATGTVTVETAFDAEPAAGDAFIILGRIET